MHYIEKSNNTFIARIGNVKLDNTKYYDSRENYKGVYGNPVRIEVGDFCLEWISNFGFGSSTHSAVYVSFKNIYIKAHTNIKSTEKYAELLNHYSNEQNINKDDLIIELASLVAHFRESAGVISRYAYGNDSIYLKPLRELESYPEDEVDRKALKKINKTFANTK